MGSRLHNLFLAYERSHLHPLNRLSHKIAVPLVLLHIVAMFTWISVWPPVTAAHVGVLVLVGWYLSLDVSLGLSVGVYIALCLAVSPLIPRPWVIGIAVIAWIIQFTGHAAWEKQKPTLFSNFVQALIAPLYFVAIITKKWTPPSLRAFAP